MVTFELSFEFKPNGMIGVTKPSDSVVYTARKLKLGGKILSLDKSRCQ